MNPLNLLACKAWQLFNDTLNLVVSITSRKQLLLLLLFFPAVSKAQQVSEIITDFGSYWKSGNGAINPVKPDNSHNLLSFTYNGKRYATGVNDSLLTAQGLSFTSFDFKALPVSQITGLVNGNTKIGLGASYDGVPNGPSNPRPENNLVKYLTDGHKGLDLGTCVANVPAGELFFPISNLQKLAIGDTIPDILVTQVADPSGSSLDRYEFTDVFGNRVGNQVDIVLNTLPVLGNWTVDFYEAGTHPMNLSSGYTRTDRAIRLWAADFSAFGIDSNNISQVAYFKIRLNGNSDIAFVGYNNSTFNIVSNSLPVKLSSFTGLLKNDAVELNWKTATEINTSRFIIETSVNGVQFFPVDSIKAAGTTPLTQHYSFTQQHPQPGKNYYRLKMVDINGHYEYSHILQFVYNTVNSIRVSTYPNPATDKLIITYPKATGNEFYQLVNQQGIVLLQQKCPAASIQQVIPVQPLPAGNYYMVWTNGKDKEVKSVIIQ